MNPDHLDHSARMPHVIQTTELRSRWSAYWSQTIVDGPRPGGRPVPGDTVRFRPGFDSRDPETRALYVFILWRLLSDDSYLDREIVRDVVRAQHVSRVDCIVAYIGPGGDHVCFGPADSYAMERVP